MNATRGCWYKALLTLVIMAIVVVSMCLLAAVVSGGELSSYRVTGSAWRLSLHGWGEVWDWGVPVHVRRDVVGPVRVVYPTTDDDPLQDLEDGHASIELPHVLTEWRGNGVLLALCSYHFGALRDVQSTNYDRAEWGHDQYVAGYYDNAMDRWLVVWKYYPTSEAARTRSHSIGSAYIRGEDLYMSFKAYERMGTLEKFPMKVICNGDTPYRGLSGWWLNGEESYRWYWSQSRIELKELKRVWRK